MVVICIKEPVRCWEGRASKVSVGNDYLVIDVVQNTKSSDMLESKVGYELAEDPGYLYDSWLFAKTSDIDETDLVEESINVTEL